jgi:hypothetical protein
MNGYDLESVPDESLWLRERTRWMVMT